MLTVETPLALGTHLRLPWQHLLRRLRTALHEAGIEDLRSAHLPVFQLLAEGDARSSSLAAIAGMTKQSMGALIDDLEAAGYVDRAADPRDGRARLVRLTQKGHEVVAISKRCMEEVENEWEAVLGGSEYQRFREALGELSRSLLPETR